MKPLSQSIRRSGRGSVLIIVIWVCLGLVARAIYFADQMTSEMRAADGQVAEVVARQAVQVSVAVDQVKPRSKQIGVASATRWQNFVARLLR